VTAALLLAIGMGAASPADSAWALRRHLAITEFGMGVMLDDPRGGTPSPMLHFALGDLHRLDERTFFGGEVAVTVHGLGESEGVLVALRPRVRREVGKGWAVDLAAGPILAGIEDDRAIDGLGFSAAAGFAYRGYVGVSAEVATRRLDAGVYPIGGQTVTTTQLGLRLGRDAGILGGIGGGILYLVVGGLIMETFSP